MWLRPRVADIIRIIHRSIDSEGTSRASLTPAHGPLSDPDMPVRLRPLLEVGRDTLVALIAIGGLLAGCNRSGTGSNGSFGPVINEVLANGHVGNVDPDDAAYGAFLLDASGSPLLDLEGRPGDSVDWVEIFNPLPIAVGLSEYTLSDNARSPRKFEFPDGMTIGPGGFVVVICDDRRELGPLHAGFRLDPRGETLFLFRNGSIVDRLGYGDVPANVSVGRSPDGQGEQDRIFAPTPGRANAPLLARPPHEVGVTVAPVGDSFRFDVQVTLDAREGNGIAAAGIEVKGLRQCGANPAVPFSAMETLVEVPGSTVPEVEPRENFRKQQLEVDVVRLLLRAEIAASAIPGHDPADPGVLRFRVVVEDAAVGASVRLGCASATASGPRLVVNEYSPRNQSLRFRRVRVDGSIDPMIGTPDWLEILNVSDEVVELAIDTDDDGVKDTGYSLVGQGGLAEILGPAPRPPCPPAENRPDCLFQWRLDNSGVERLAPGERIVVLADNDNPPFRVYFSLDDPPLPFVRGDANGDGSVDDADRVALVQLLARIEAAPPLFNRVPCQDAVDVDDDGEFDAADITALVAHLDTGDPLPAPFPAVGNDPTPDTLECREPFSSSQFRISGDGADTFALVDPLRLPIDIVDIDFSRPIPPEFRDPRGGIIPDISFGRFPDGFGAGTPLTMANLDFGDAGDSAHTVFGACPTPGAPNQRDCERQPVAPRWDPNVWMTIGGGGAGRVCPTPTQSPEVFAFVAIDTVVFDADTRAAPTFDVELTFQGEGAPVTVTRTSGLDVRRASECQRECFAADIVPRATLLRASFQLPPQPAGTLVTFSFLARDRVLANDPELGDQAVAILDESSPGVDHASFRYVVQGTPARRVVFNEVLPANDSFLRELYPDPAPPGFEPPAYAELFNPTDRPVDLGGMFLAEARDGRCAQGFDCPPDRIDDVRAFEIPADTVIEPRGLLLVLFVHDNERNTAPRLAGQPFEGRTLLVPDSIRLDGCREQLFLISDDASGNCQLARIAWDFRTPAEKLNGVLECGLSTVDQAVGRLPDGANQLSELRVPSPGRPNCVYRPPELDGEVNTIIAPPLGPDRCVRDGATVQVGWNTLNDLVEVERNPAVLGLEVVEIRLSLDGVPREPRPIQEFPHVLVRSTAPGQPACRASIAYQVTVPIPSQTASQQTLEMRVRVVDTAGGELEFGPLSFEICGRAEVLFIRGDVNGDTRVNVSDLVVLNRIVLGLAAPPPCQDAADVDDSGVIDADDVTALGAFLQSRRTIPRPFPNPGVDPTPDGLECR